MASSSRAILVICTIVCIPACCSGFHQPHTTTTVSSFRSLPLTQQSTRIRSSTSSSLDQIIRDNNSIRDNDDDNVHQYKVENKNNSEIELWLDLRGTSLTPKAALELWHLDERQNNQQEEEDDTTNNKSLTKTPFVKCLVSPNAKKYKEKEQINGIDILHVVAESDNDNDMKIILQNANQSPSSTGARDESIGRILSLRKSPSLMPILPDPLPAMEVVSQGQWLIVDTNNWKKVLEEDRISMALSLVELISSGSIGGGGVGLTCHTNNEIVKAAMLVQSLTSSGRGGSGGGGKMGTKTLESGIVIPNDDEDLDSALEDADTRIRDGRTSFALVVPFDMGLLQTAQLLLEGN